MYNILGILHLKDQCNHNFYMHLEINPFCYPVYREAHFIVEIQICFISELGLYIFPLIMQNRHWKDTVNVQGICCLS